MRKNPLIKYHSLQLKTKIKAFLLLVLMVFVAFLIFFPNNVLREKETSLPQRQLTENKILIATQQSYFRDSVTAILKNNFREKNISVQLIDIQSLPEVDPNAYSAVIVIHMWQTWSAPEVVNNFIERTKTQSEKIIILTTSSNGTYAPKNVDAITGASIIADAALYADKVMKRTAFLLDKNN